MNRLYLLLMLLGFFHPAFSQDSINRFDASGRREGRWKKTDTAGHTVYEGQFNKGVPFGEFRYFYADGKLKTVTRFSKDGKTARAVSYAKNGRKIAEGNYHNEKKDSTWRYYSDFDGVLLSEESYTNGLINGVSKTFYPGGTVAEVIQYRDGKKDGEWVQYYEDGRLKFKGSYRNDEKEGPFTGYFQNGKVNLSGAYRAGHKEGTWTIYEENGAVMRSDKYSDGAVVIEKNK